MKPSPKYRYSNRHLSVRRPRWQRWLGLGLFDRTKAIGSATLTTIQNTQWWKGLTNTTWTTYNYVELATLAKENPFSARALWLMKELCSSLPFQMGTFEDDGTFTPNPDHPFAPCLRKPDERTSWQTFVGQLVEHAWFGGEHFYYFPDTTLTGTKAGLPIDGSGMRLLRPDRVVEIEFSEVDPDRAVRYRYDPVQSRFKAFWIPASRILHVKTENHENPDRGWAFMRCILRALDMMRDGDDWNKSISHDKGRLGGYVTWTPPAPGEVMDPDTWRFVKGEIQRQYDLARESNRLMFLGGEYKFQEASMKPTDADWLGADQSWARKIAIGTGFDPAILGDAAHKTYSNFETALRAAYVLTVIPFMEWVFDELNTRLVERYDTDDVIVIDRDMIIALEDDADKRHARLRADVEVGALNRDEMRAEIGYEAVGTPEMQAHTVSLNTMRIEQISENESLALRRPVPDWSSSGDGTTTDDLPTYEL